METINVPTAEDIKQWVREAIIEILPTVLSDKTIISETSEPLLSREDAASIFGVTLVTLHDWMNKGLPFHKQGGRTYFLRSEILEYVKQNKK